MDVPVKKRGVDLGTFIYKIMTKTKFVELSVAHGCIFLEFGNFSAIALQKQYPENLFVSPPNRKISL